MKSLPEDSAHVVDGLSNNNLQFYISKAVKHQFAMHGAPREKAEMHSKSNTQ
jgi:hypothetical protein